MTCWLAGTFDLKLPTDVFLSQIEQVSQLAALVQAQLGYHSRSAEILTQLSSQIDERSALALPHCSACRMLEVFRAPEVSKVPVLFRTAGWGKRPANPGKSLFPNLASPWISPSARTTTEESTEPVLQVRSTPWSLQPANTEWNQARFWFVHF